MADEQTMLRVAGVLLRAVELESVPYVKRLRRLLKDSASLYNLANVPALQGEPYAEAVRNSLLTLGAAVADCIELLEKENEV